MRRLLYIALPILSAFACAASPAQAQVLCRFDHNGGTMTLNANKTGVWVGGANAGEFSRQRGDNTWRLEGHTLRMDWVIVTEGPMKGRTGWTRAPVTACPKAAG
jgi:hypothetical protein